MVNVRKILGNTLMISGMLTTGGSLADSVRNSAYRRESQARFNILAELNKKYGVGMECTPGGASSICYTVVYGRYAENERRAILDQYSEELGARLDAVPTDPVANARAERDGLGFMVGLGIVAAGVELKRGQQFRRIESRRGGRKEGR